MSGRKLLSYYTYYPIDNTEKVKTRQNKCCALLRNRLYGCRLGSVTENQCKVEKNNGDFPHVDCEEADCYWWGQFIRFYRSIRA